MANPEQNNEENSFLTIASLGAIIGFIIPLIMWALKKDNFSDYTKKFLKDILNFELVLFIIVILLGWIPLIGQLLCLVIFVANLIIAINCCNATKEKKDYSLPINIQLIK
ncbi:DUF4870 domain-containing protein [bacterium]|nr:DUF4870 domain-containing protein [bacterium]